MRELKFRALNADGEWCYGLPYYDQDGDLDMSLKSGYSDYGDIEKTLGQFTGLKDKNGVEIYEGDIVKLKGLAKGGQVGVVIYSESACKFAVRIYRDGYKKNEPHLIAIRGSCVIGNIHQNPELLK